MPSVIDITDTDVPCPGRDCTVLLARLTKQVDGSQRTFNEWVCRKGAQHVTQQWAPPAEYEVL